MPITTWTDISNTFEISRNGDLKKDQDIDAVKNSITNIFKTMQGDRRMLPDFAMAIQRLLFEPMDEETANRLGNYILHGIEYWEPRVSINNIHINANYDRNTYDVTLTFTVRRIEEIVTLDYVLKRK